MRIFQPTVTGSNTTTGSLHVSGPVFFYTLETSSVFHVLTYNTASGQVFFTASDAFKGIPDDPPNSIQFNYSGNFSGSANLTFVDNVVYLTGSLNTSGSIILTGSFDVSGSTNVIGTSTITGSLNISGSTNTIGTSTITGSLVITGSTTLTGSMFVTGAISASSGPNTVGFYGTASWAQNALTASFITASNVYGPFGSSSVNSASYASSSTSASFAGTASLAFTASFITGAGVFGPFGSNSVLSASYASSSTSASYALFSTSASFAENSRPAPEDTWIQYNEKEAFGAESYFRYIYDSHSFQQGNLVTASGDYSHAQGYNTLVGWKGFNVVAISGGIIQIQDNVDYSSEFTSLDTVILYQPNYHYAIHSYYSTSYSPTFGDFFIYLSDPGVNTYPSAPTVGTTVADTTNLFSPLAYVQQGNYSHAEGTGTQAYGNYSHAEGNASKAYGRDVHAEGGGIAYGEASHAEGGGTSYGTAAHAEGYSTAIGSYSHAEGSGIAGAIGLLVTSVTDGLIAISRDTDFSVLFPSNNTLVLYYNNTAKPYTYTAVTYDSPNFTIQLDDTTVNIVTDSYIAPLGNPSGAWLYGNNNTTPLIGVYSHAEGSGKTFGERSHAEGNQTITYGNYSHAEGFQTITSGEGAHAEGTTTTALGDYSHTEGYYTISSGSYSHAEGSGSIALGIASHAEGWRNTASGNYSHAEGERNKVFGNGSHVEGRVNYISESSRWSHVGGLQNSASGWYQTVFGQNNKPILSQSAFIIGGDSYSAPPSVRWNMFVAIPKTDFIDPANSATPSDAIIEMRADTASISASYLYLNNLPTSSVPFVLIYNTASGQVFYTASNAIGGGGTPTPPAPQDTWIQYNSGSTFGATGSFRFIYTSQSFQQGSGVTASGRFSHAQGSGSIALGIGSHTEGFQTIASGSSAHAEGSNTVALGLSSHAEGSASIALGVASHTEGLFTIASGSFQTVVGQYNIANTSQSAFIIGDGTADNARHNVLFASQSWFEVSASNVYFQGLPQTSSNSILVYDSSSGQVFYTASTSYTITASNGLTFTPGTPDQIKLGGILTQNTTINADNDGNGYSLNLVGDDSTSTKNYVFTINNDRPKSSMLISNTRTGGATTAVGLQISSVDIAINSSTTGELHNARFVSNKVNALQLRTTSSSLGILTAPSSSDLDNVSLLVEGYNYISKTNNGIPDTASITMIHLYRNSNYSPGNGAAGSIDYSFDISGNDFERRTTRLVSLLDEANASNGLEGSFEIHTLNSNSLDSKLRIDYQGQLTLNKYTASNSFDDVSGTSVGVLHADNTGKIFISSSGGGGSGTITGITAGDGLSGGGSSGDITLALNSTSSAVGGVGTSYTINHNFGTRNVHVTVYSASGTYETVYPDIQRPTTSSVTVLFNNVPAAGEFIVYISR